MASTVEDSKSVNGAAESPAKERQKVYIGRRTGAVIKINPRKDSHGFDRIEDYFPDSVLESDNEETNSWDAKPVKLKANQYVGRRTGALIEINARKNRHGFELIEDYFPDSIRESDVSTESNKDLNNDRKLSTSLKTTDKEKSWEPATEHKENMSQNMLEPEEKSQVSSLSKENKDIVTPQEKEIEISINLTGTAVKNSAASNEPTPQFFGSKKRLFTSAAENTDVTREKNIETEEDIDIVGISYEEGETNAQHQQKANNTQTVKEVSMTTEDDSIVVDVEGFDTPYMTLNDKSKGSKVKGGVQEDEEATAGKTKEDTLIVDIEDDSTFVTLGDKSKVSMLKSVSHGDLVPDNEESYQMDESAVLEGTKHKAMSPEFGSVSTHVSSNSGTENDETEDMAKPKGRRSRKSKKSVSKKSIKEQEREGDENQNDDGDKSVDHQKDDSTSMNPVVKRVTRSRSMKSVSNKSMKEKQDKSQENVTLNLTGADQTNVDDTARVSPVRKVTRKSKRSAVLNKSTKEKEEESQKDISLNITSADQTYEDDTAHANSMKKTTRKSEKSVSNRSMEEKQLEEDNDIEVTAETKANHDVEDEKTAKKRTLRKSTRTTQKEPDNENTADAVQEDEEELKERVMTRRATRSNTSNHARIKSTSKKPPAPGRRSTRSEVNKSMTSDKNVSGELKTKRNESESKSIGAVEDVVSDGKKHEVQGEDGGNTSRLFEIEDDMPGDAEYEVYDTEVHDTQGEDKCVDTLKDRLSKRRSTRNKSQVNDSKSKSETEEVEESVEEKGGNGSSDDDGDGDDEQESQEIGKKTTKNSKNTKERKVENKGAAWRATLNNQDNDSNHDDDDDDDDHDDYDDDGHDDYDDDDHDDNYEYDDKEENNDQDGDGNNSKIISKNERTKSKSSKKSASSSSASDSDKDRVEEKKQPRKQKRKSSKVSMTRRSTRKPSKNYTANETAGNDVTDQEGPADEGDDGTKDDERNDTTVKETVDRSMNKSSRKRTNQTRIESMQVAQSSTPFFLNGSPYILPPGSVKSILKSNIPRTLSTDAKKRRVSIATNKKGSTSGTDDEDDEDYGNDEGGKSKFPSRRRKSSVSFAPTPSFHISPDDFSTLEESSGELAKLSFLTNYSGFTSGDNTFTPGLLGSASLSSSVSSLGSVSDLLSDTSSVNESQEITINSSKRRQLAEEEEQLDDSGVRRSKRTKVPPLEYWKNERIKYDRRQSGWYVSGIQKVATPVVPKRKSKKRKKQKKTEATGRESHEEEANDFYGEPADMEEVTYTSIPVVNPDNGEQVELDLVHTPEMLNFVNASGKPAEPEDPLIMDKFMSHNLFGTGQIVLRPGAEKGKQHVRDDTMIFYVVKGRVEVTVHETTVLLRTGSTFFVPTGNWYNIKNVQNSDARLLFVQIKG